MAKNFLVITILIISVSLLAWIFNHFSDVQSEDVQQVEVETLQGQGMDDGRETDCQQSMPKSGSKYLLSGIDLTFQSRAQLFIGNEHNFPVWIRIFEADSSEEFGAIFLKAHKSSQFQLPVNGYRIVVESGTMWCNLQAGFIDAVFVQSDKVMELQKGERTTLRLLSYGYQPADMMVSISSTASLNQLGANKIHGSGRLTLQRVLGGHYAVAGSINGVPAHFLVDTGATNVSIPENFAKHAGISACQQSKVRTANGVTDVCIAKARTLTIGQFTLKDVTVNYGKGLPEDTFLLGMNVIRQFRMEQQDDVMTLSLY